MGGRLSPIIIILLLIVVVVMGIFVFGMLKTDPITENNVVTEPVAKIPPEITTEQEYIEDDGIVKITVNATTEDEQGIKEIILPDNSIYEGSSTTFEVNANGEYEFVAVGMNGKNASTKVNVEEIPTPTSSKPYVPEGFKILNDNVDEGFVVADKYDNQYVWVPVAKGQMTRERMFNTDYSDDASELVNSVAKYYGFYVARFEASQYDTGNGYVAASIAGKIPWTNINYVDAYSASLNAAGVYGYKECSTSLISSYAWDTILAWADENYDSFSSSNKNGNYSGTILPTGSTESDIVYNICDISGNVKEWTTETEKNNSSSNKSNKKEDNVISRVIRGGNANLANTPKSYKGNPENSSDNYWGFRMVLYKRG